MKHLLLFFLFINYQATFLGQYIPTHSEDRSLHSSTPATFLNSKHGKAAIDAKAIDHWLKLGHSNTVKITNDGDYFCYALENQPYKSRTVVVQSINGSWKKEFVGASSGFFS